MPILLGLIALALPRFVIALLWLASSWFDGVFETRLWPILGFLFLPLTLLWYSVVEKMLGGVWSWWAVVILVVAIVSDLSSSKSVKRS